MEYNDRHRQFLQAITQRGTLIQDDAKGYVFKFFDGNQKLDIVIAHINVKLEPLQLKIVSAACELTGQTYCMLVNTIYDESVTFSSQYSYLERQFLKNVFDEIIRSEDGSITSTDCINLEGEIGDKQLSHGEKEKFLRDASNHKWLHYDDGIIYMGVRSIAELMPYFRENYAEFDIIKNCELCKQVVFHKTVCPHCETSYHLLCITNFTSLRKSNECSKCKNPLPMIDLDAVAVFNSQRDEEQDDELSQTISHTKKGGRRSRRQ